MLTIIMTFDGTTEERKQNVEKVSKEIDAEVFNGGKSTFTNFFDIIMKAKEKDEDLLLLEDDVMPCKDFNNRVSKVISEKPNTIIQLFSYGHERFWRPFDKLVGMQAIYIPKCKFEMILTKLTELLIKRSDLVRTNDYEKILRFLDGFYYVTEVNYVQTMTTPSTILKNFIDPSSYFFIDDL